MSGLRYKTGLHCLIYFLFSHFLLSCFFISGCCWQVWHW